MQELILHNNIGGGHMRIILSIAVAAVSVSAQYDAIVIGAGLVRDISIVRGICPFTNNNETIIKQQTVWSIYC